MREPESCLRRNWALGHLDDAFVYDRDSGGTLIPKRYICSIIKALTSRRGPLNVARSPQGQPIVIEAGSSEPGKALAAENADVVLTNQSSLSSAMAFYADLKGHLSQYGRRLDDLKILPGLFPVLGRSQQEAEEKFEELQSLIHPDVGIKFLSEMLGGVDLSDCSIDGPLPPITDLKLQQDRSASDPRDGRVRPFHQAALSSPRV